MTTRFTGPRKPRPPHTGSWSCVPQEVLVDEGHFDQAVAALHRAGIVVRLEPLLGSGVVRLRLEGSTELSVPSIVRTLRRDHPSLRVAPNYMIRAASHLHMLGTRSPEPAPALPDLPTGDHLPGHGVRVGVVDSGFCPDPWFGNRVEARPEDLEGPPPTKGDALPFVTGHGTFVTGIILQRAPGARVVARKIIDDDDGHVSDSTLAAVLDEMDAIDILNLSLGTTAIDRDDAVGLLATANSLLKLWKKNPNLVVVAPAGNDGRDTEFWPARFDPVVAVAALNEAGTDPASFTNFGGWVDACAKGENVHSRFVDWGGDVETPPQNGHGRGRRVQSEPFAGWATWDGTSFAAARVTGAIAAALDKAAGMDGPSAVAQVLSGPTPFPGLGAVVN